MEHWAQKCDGAGVDPAEYAAVCKERDEMKAALEQVSAERDVLVESIKRGPPPDPCSLCKHNSVGLACDGLDECASCENRCPCGSCDLHACNFELVSVKKEKVK